MHGATKFIKTKNGESGRQGVKSIHALGSDRNISSAVLGCSSWSWLLFFDCCFPSTGQSLPPGEGHGAGCPPESLLYRKFLYMRGGSNGQWLLPLPRKSRWLLCELLLWHQKVTFCEMFNLIHTFLMVGVSSSYYVSKCAILLPQPPQCSDYSPTAPYLGQNDFFVILIIIIRRSISELPCCLWYDVKKLALCLS